MFIRTHCTSEKSGLENSDYWYNLLVSVRIYKTLIKVLPTSEGSGIENSD